MIPKWLIAEHVEGGRNFVLHMEAPRLVFEAFDTDYGHELKWLDDGSELDWDCPPEIKAATLARAAREAGDAYLEYNRKLAEENDVEVKGRDIDLIIRLANECAEAMGGWE